MKVYTIKHFLLLIIMLRGIICFSQNNNLRVQNDTIKLNTVVVIAKLPVPQKIKKDFFEHNDILITYIYEDGWILFFEGGMTELWIDNYMPSNEETRTDFKSYSGMFDNKYWRRDYYQKCKIYYDEVLPKTKSKYDGILNNIKIMGE